LAEKQSKEYHKVSKDVPSGSSLSFGNRGLGLGIFYGGILIRFAIRSFGMRFDLLKKFIIQSMSFFGKVDFRNNSLRTSTGLGAFNL